MCGIAGILQTSDQKIEPQHLDLMTASLNHRGPDSCSTEHMGRIGLAHTRLQIIDLSQNASQPLANEDNSIWVVFNGEIYDHTHHQSELKRRGHIFRSHSDTEVIVHTYEEYGLKGLAQLNGMFAYAIWDNNRQQLILARDRTGQKPLYIYEHQDRIIFSSEIKAILQVPGVDTSIHSSAIPSYLSNGYVPAPNTFYKYIRKLNPGTFCIYTAHQQGPKEHTFWQVPSTSAHPPSIEEATHTIYDKLEAAVIRRMVADVPLGAFLSGGIDSSIIVGLMARHCARPIQTFCLGFEDHPHDERPYARRVAEHFGTQHIELNARSNCFNELPKLLMHMDEPFGDTSLLPTALICNLAREHTSVVLTGDGGDELFAGYQRFISSSLPEYLPEPITDVLSASAGTLNRLRPPPGIAGQALRYIHRMGGSSAQRLHSWIAIFRPHELKTLLRCGYVHNLANIIPFHFEQNTDNDIINHLLKINAGSYLLEDLNVKLDRASMYSSLEARSPFLDVDMLDYTFSLPGSYKIRWGQNKYLLRKAFANLVPEWVFHRKKLGFGLPLAQWFRGPLRELVHDTLTPSSARIYDRLNIQPVRTMLHEHMTKRRDRSYQIWSLLALELWLARHPVRTEP